MSKRVLRGIFLFAGIILTFFCAIANAIDIKVGAIRWDAWYGGNTDSPNSPAAAVEKTLQDKRWRYRTPTFMKENPDGTITLNGATREIIDEEIRLAHNAGLSFWSYCTYAKDSGMSKALALHRSSKIKNLMPFCAIITPGTLQNKEMYGYILELLQDDAYFKVEGRPVIFMLCIYTNPLEKDALDKANMKNLFNKFKADVKRILGDPIVVIQDSAPEGRTKFAAEYFGAQAVSAYWALEWKEKGAYEDIISWGNKYWDRLKTTGYGVVPIVTTGADPRPRYINPVPWEKRKKPDPNNNLYYEHATPEQIADFLKDAIDFVKANPQICPYGLINIYAWNEYDEGGWLAPTFGDKTSRLDAIKKVIEQNR